MPPENDDLRTALEEAFNAQEGGDTTPSSEAGRSEENTSEPVRTAAPTEKSEPAGTAPAGTEPAPAPGEAKLDGPKAEADGTPYERKQTDRAPESWRPATREHWSKLPPEVREEVMKRETEMNTFVQRTAAQRKIADQFVQIVQPYMGMIQSEGGNPLQAVNNLLQTAAFLRTGPQAQKAVLVAKLVKDFGISVEDLDRALVGEQVPDKPEDKINELLERRLAPVNQFIEQIQGVRQQRSQQVDQQVDQEIATFAQDPKNEFFKDVYNDMADLVEIAARRGQSLSLKDAYDKACLMSPAVQEAIRKRNDAKRSASSSVPLRGAAATASASKSGDDIRSDLEAAFETFAGR